MKIIIIGTTASSFTNFRASLIRKLVFNKHEVFAFAIDYSNDSRSKLIEWGVTPIDYKLSRSGLNPIVDLKMMFQLKTKFEYIKPDIVFSYFVKPIIYGTLAARLAKIPTRIVMFEGLGFAFTNQPQGMAIKTKLIQKIQLFLYRIVLPTATNLVFLNTDDRDELLIKHKINFNEVSVLGGIGLNLDEYSYFKPQSKVIRFLFIGRLLKEKGIFDFLEAAKMVKIEYPNAEFIILGEIDSTSPNTLSKETLSDYIKSGLVIYPGYVENVLSWINYCSVFVLPSYREGFPRSSQEAMAVGRPILTTDVPGCRETAVDLKNGFLVPAFDVEKLAEKMIWFIQNPDKIESMGLASRCIAEEKFDEDKFNTKILKIMGIK